LDESRLKYVFTIHHGLEEKEVTLLKELKMEALNDFEEMKESLAAIRMESIQAFWRKHQF